MVGLGGLRARRGTTWGEYVGAGLGKSGGWVRWWGWIGWVLGGYWGGRVFLSVWLGIIKSKLSYWKGPLVAIYICEELGFNREDIAKNLLCICSVFALYLLCIFVYGVIKLCLGPPIVVKCRHDWGGGKSFTW